MSREIKYMVGFEGKLYPIREMNWDRAWVQFGYNQESHVRDCEEVTLHEWTGLLDKEGN